MPNSGLKPQARSYALALLALFFAAGLALPLQAAPQWVSIGPTGGVVTQLVQASSEPQRLYVATYPSGIYRSLDGARTWQSIDRGIEGLEVRRLAVDPRNSNVLLASTQRDSAVVQIWRSQDGGASWTLAAKPPRAQGFVRETYDFLFDTLAPRTVYAATGAGIFRSLDGGSTWNAWALPNLIAVAIARDPASPANWFVSGRELPGFANVLYRSTDGGATWTLAPSVGGPGFSNAPERLFFRAGALYAVWSGALYRSTDGASRWSLAAKLPTIAATDFTLSAAGSIYASTSLGVYVSTDGVSWSPAEAASTEQSSPRDMIFDLAVVGEGARPSDETVVAVGRRGVWRSTDGGQVWRAASRGLAVRLVGSLIVVPNPQGTVVGSFEEGLFKTDRGETAWQRLPRQLGFEAPILAADPHRPGRIYGLGTEGLGVSDDQGKTWRTVGALRHDFAYLLRVDPFHPGVLYAGVELGGGSSANGFGYRSTDGGATWTEILGFDYLLDVTFDAAQRNVAYRATFSGVDKSTDRGATWTPLPNLRSQLLGASPSTVLYEPWTRSLYVGTDNRGVFRSTDGGTTFRRLIGGLPRLTGGQNPYVGTLLLDAAGDVYVGLDKAGVFRLRSGQGWTAVNAGLPLDTFRGRLIADPARAGLLYAATQGSSVLRLEDR